MTVETPFHGERRDAEHPGHALDVTVAARAWDARLGVHAVVKVDEVWQRVDALPRDRNAREIAGANRLEQRAAGPDLVVAAHAHGRSGDARVLFVGCSGMAVQARDSVVADVMAVIELDGLLERLILVGAIGRSHVDHRGDERDGEAHDAYSQHEAEEGVRPPRKER